MGSSKFDTTTEGKYQGNTFFKKKLSLKFKMAVVDGREGRERRSTAL